MEIKNSGFLEYLLNLAEELKKKGSDKGVTKNTFFAAVLKSCSEIVGLTGNFDADEVNAVYELVKKNISLENNEEKLQALLAEPIGNADAMDFSFLFILAKKVAEKSDNGIISAELLLRFVIESPTDAIKKIMEQPKEEKPSAFSVDSLKKTSSSLSDIFSKRKEEKEVVEAEKVEKVEEVKTSQPKSIDISKTAPTKEKIEQLTENTKKLQKVLSEAVLGQENAIEIVTAGYFQGELRAITDKKARKPKATFLFAGPPGVGKTFLAEKTAEFLDIPFKRFDMSEYSLPNAVPQLCGYKGGFEGLLTGFVARNPKCILLFDEIEKSYIDVIYLFLQVLDAGRLRDAKNGNEVSFKDAIIIFTTNAGREIYEGATTNNLAHISRKTILKALEKDVDPHTGNAAFPAAICSRFATGNVVMFNHMEAHILRSIAEKELSKHITEFEKETKINCEIADEIPSCIVFAEGGLADARTVTARAGAFFSKEVYELFRLVSADESAIKNIENINVVLSLDNCEEAAANLFKQKNKPSVLVFASEKIASEVVANLTDIDVVSVSSYDEAIQLLEKNGFDLFLCDLYTGIADVEEKLNIEDVYSEGSKFFEYACETLDTPLYIVCDEQNTYTDEEMFSLIKQGARQCVDVSKKEEFIETIKEIFVQIREQASMMELAKASKIITYKSAQTISSDGKTANILIYDVELETAVDAEDASTIVGDLSRPNVKLDDVIGADSAKEELKFFIDYLKNPKEFAKKGLALPKGLLFYGPPGTGKTLLAKALAGESNLTFISTEGNKFLDKYVGVGPARIHALFRTARKYAPAIVFIDEVDAIAKERSGEHAAPDDILTALLSEMDGFNVNPNKPVFVLAATNYSAVPDGTKKVLDGAFVRRFDRQLYIDLPNKEARIKFMKKQIEKNKSYKLSDSEIENLAIRSTGMSLANLAAVFNFSMRIAMRQGKDIVDSAVFEEAFETFNYGDKKQWDASELKKTAYHEAGHAFLCWQSGEKPSYVTIVARGNHGGYMLHGDNEQKGSYSKQMLLNRIRTALGGRASELVFFGEDDGLTTGASGDLATATAVAKSMVCRYGMDSSIGLAVVDDAEAQDGAMAMKVREVVNTILNEELAKAKKLLSENKRAVDALVEALMNKNHLTADEIDKIFTENTK